MNNDAAKETSCRGSIESLQAFHYEVLVQIMDLHNIHITEV